LGSRTHPSTLLAALHLIHTFINTHTGSEQDSRSQLASTLFDLWWKRLLQVAGQVQSGGSALGAMSSWTAMIGLSVSLATRRPKAYLAVTVDNLLKMVSAWEQRQSWRNWGRKAIKNALVACVRLAFLRRHVLINPKTSNLEL
jgi:hypothetical protein